MMNSVLRMISLSLTLFLTQMNFAQQLSLNDLKSIMSDVKVFENKMIYLGNFMLSKSDSPGYSYKGVDGSIGSSRINPTVDRNADEFDYVVQYIGERSEFAENYDEEREVATTFYSWWSVQDLQNIVGSEKLDFYTTLEIQYNRESDYQAISRAIVSSCAYIKSEETYPGSREYVHVYHSGQFEFKIRKNSNYGMVNIKCVLQ